MKKIRKHEIALLTEHIFNMLNETVDTFYASEFQGVLYMIILEKLRGEIKDEDFEITPYNELRGYNKFRTGKKNAKKIYNTELESYLLEDGTVSFTDGKTYNNVGNFPFQNYPLHDNDIIQNWIGNPHFTILELYEFTNDLWDLFNGQVDISQPIINHQAEIDVNHLDENIDYRYRGLYSIYQNIVPSYNNEDQDTKNYFEVVIGAALFYLPQPVKESWTGEMSFNLLRSLVSKNNNTVKKVKDHVFARKRAANEILNNDFTIEHFSQRYDDVYRKFTYLTSNENNILINWHQEYPTYLEALAGNQINLINIQAAGIKHALINGFLGYCRSIDINWSDDFETFSGQINATANQFLAQD